ncbi:Unknown protein sequence [Pseudomonas syringae pv. cilantro]|uniref:Uncharacterized protein n=1 Tax=Pseudomonas syringae pv. cilantro TaxID=81035 RepID=A0A0N0GEQ2_PSESX|nr:Unknown protein sequence [Pseudomonas syringae pv. cilantro]KPW75811.1 hypothetical protein ALO76_102200 [Pseudomonas syringae pv. coriandricola]
MSHIATCRVEPISHSVGAAKSGDLFRSGLWFCEQFLFPDWQTV